MSMLSEEQVSSYINALIRLGALHKVSSQDGGDEMIRFKVRSKRIIGRIFGGEFGELPEGADAVPWFSCLLVKTLLDEKDIAVSKTEFTGMAAIIMGFMTEPAASLRLRSDDDHLVVSRSRAKKRRD